MRNTRPFITLIVALSMAACTSTTNYYGQDPEMQSALSPAQSPVQPRAKNVILFIGDGMGISTITAARIYAGQKLGQTGEEYVLPLSLIHI